MSKDNQPVEQQMKTVSEIADKYRQSMYPNDPNPTGYYNEAGYNGFVAGVNHNIQVIENRIAELEIEMFDNNQSFEWNLIKQGELKSAKNLLKQLQS